MTDSRVQEVNGLATWTEGGEGRWYDQAGSSSDRP